MDQAKSAALLTWAKARLRGPSIHLTAGKVRNFDALIESVRDQGARRAVEYDCPYPKYEFPSYLISDLGYLLHGSSEPEIEMFEPRHASDIYDFSARRAVYAASDGVWPMVFAIRARRAQQGTFVNGCSRVVYQDGTRSQPYYHFALAAAGLQERPWTRGTMYVLPRETFVPHPLVHEDGITVTLAEWASAEVIVPLAKIEVQPDDVPFLDEFWGYDPQRLGRRHVWTDLDQEDKELFPVRPLRSSQT